MAQPGITLRHAKSCSARRGRSCDCSPAFQSWVYDHRVDRKVYKTHRSAAAAKNWRQDMLVAIRRGEVAAARSTVTVADAVDAWLDGARKGTVRTRGRKPFAGGTIRSVEQNYRLRVAERFGRRRLDRVSLLELQEWVDELDGDGVHPGTIETTVLPLRMAYRRAKTRGEVTHDPTDGLELPQKPVRGSTRRPPDASLIISVLVGAPTPDRAAWAVFMLAGLRRGELLGLRWSDVDLDASTIHAAQQYAPAEAIFKVTKGRRERKVPLGATLAAELRAHRLLTGRREGLVFGADGQRAMDTGKFQARADVAWKAAGVQRITPHAGRHLYASMSAAAGTPIERLSRYMGHSSIAVTWDNYGHLFPGDEVADATLQDAFLAARSSHQERTARDH